MLATHILVTVALESGTLRFWDGVGGPYVDPDTGDVYRASQFTEDALQSIEAAINGEAFTLALSLVSVPTGAADEIWEYDETNPVSGSVIQISLQNCDQYNQPTEDPEVVFTGTLDNMTVTDQTSESEEGDSQRSTITIEATNVFTLRNITNRAVLSDVDQRARSAILNPSASADRFCERVSQLLSKTIRWPNW